MKKKQIKIHYSAKLDNMLAEIEEKWGDVDVWYGLKLEPTYDLGLSEMISLVNKSIKLKRPMFEICGEYPLVAFGTLAELKERFRAFTEKMEAYDKREQAKLENEESKQKVAKIKQLEAELKKLKGK